MIVDEVQRVAGDQDERGVRHERGSFAEEFEAVHLRHVIIGDDDADVERGQSGEGLAGAGEREDGAAEIFGQHGREEVDVGFFVVDDDDGFARRVHGGWSRDLAGIAIQRQCERRGLSF